MIILQIPQEVRISKQKGIYNENFSQINLQGK